MPSAALQDIKKELKELSQKDLAELCQKMARYKKDNKEYMAYLLFRAHDKPQFLKEVKEEVDEQFVALSTQTNLYYAKKSLRKILRIINKYAKYADDKALAADLHIYFLIRMKNSGIAFQKSQQLMNLYERELAKINTLLGTLHEDLRADYAGDLERIAL
jgi:hypothetical protein